MEPIYGDPLRMDRRGKFARGEPCHSYVINCPVELGRDSNWIDYRYALGRTGGGDGDGGDGAGDFIRFPTRSARRTEGMTEKYPTVITAGFCNYTLRKYPVPPEIYTYAAYIGA